MPTELLLDWIITYIINTLFWLWITIWGGAEKLENSFISGFIINIFSVNWSAEVIKFYGWLIIIGTTVWFFVGLFIPELRFHWG